MLTNKQRDLLKKLIFTMNELSLECEKDDEFNITLARTGVFDKDLNEGAHTLYDFLEGK